MYEIKNKTLVYKKKPVYNLQLHIYFEHLLFYKRLFVPRHYAQIVKTKCKWKQIIIIVAYRTVGF